MATVSTALESARTLLNDDAATLWTDAVLLPKVREAHRELQVALTLNGLPVIKEVSAIIDVPASTLTLPTQPADIVEPIWMKERPDGGTADDFVDMEEVDFLPDVLQAEDLHYWAWREEVISFVGATTAREVQLRYKKGLPTINGGSDSIGFVYGELYLGPRTAAIAALSVGNKSVHDDLTSLAMNNIDKILRMNVLGQQHLPARRKPYRRRRVIGLQVR